MCTKKQLSSISEQMVDIYHSVYGNAVSDVFLYGSYARGDNDKDSDIDIVAIVKGTRMDLQNRLRVIWDLSADIGLENDVIVSPTVIPYNEFEEYKHILPYYRNIAEEGLKIG